MILKQIKSSYLVKNLGILVSGTVISQAIVFAFQLFLRRIYSPEDFGAFAIYMSIVGIVVSITALKYEQTIVLPKLDSDGLGLLKIAILVSVVIVSLFSAALYFFSSWFIDLVGLPAAYKHWLVYLPFSVLLFTCALAINYYLLRLKRFKISGSNKVVRRLGEGLVQTVSGTMGKASGLVLGDIIGQVIVIIRSVFVIIKSKPIANSKTSLFDLVLRYKNFPLKNTLPSLLNAFSRLLPVILISRFFTAEVVGYFDLARTMLIIPLSMITVSLNQVLVQRFSEKRNNKQSIKKEALGVFYSLLAGSILFVLFVEFMGVPVFKLLFGSIWVSSGIYAKVLIWAFALKFLVSPFNSCFIAFEKIGIGSLWQTFYFILIVSLFFVPHTNILNFLRIYMAVEVFAFLVAGFINFSILQSYEKQIKSESKQ